MFQTDRSDGDAMFWRLCHELPSVRGTAVGGDGNILGADGIGCVRDVRSRRVYGAREATEG
jgi:hypothetical protein